MLRAPVGPPVTGPFAGSRHGSDIVFARSIAEQAGALLMDRYERILSISHKSPKDVVTEVDHLSEELILGAIRSRHPGDGILAEESGEHHVVPGGDGSGRATLGRGRTWVIDPIDGTINYANGIPFFCVSIALLEDGTPIVGVVHDPARAETFAAVADGPAALGERVVRVSSKEKLTDFVVSLALGGKGVAGRSRATRRAIRVSRNMGSAALALAYVANARFDAFVQSGGLSAWDVAAAGLIAERGGAQVTANDGSAWFDIGRGSREFGVIAAPPAHHEVLRQLVT